MTTLVTGGAGYVGGFAVRALRAAGEDVVVLDNLSTGHAETVPDGVPLLITDLRDATAVRAALAGVRVSAVLHFAASAYVGESVANPRKYWENNVVATANLLGALLEGGGAPPPVVFSSTCSLYGDAGGAPLGEDLRPAPVNPYARTKLAIERMLEDYDAAYGLRSFRLRYFNAAGAASDGTLGERHDPEPHLIPLAIGAVLRGPPLRVFGCDWPTPDGTCVRDYVHVEDLADAHVAAVAALRRGHAGGALNLGTGRGSSVRDVVAAVERASGRRVPVLEAPRREGDPAALAAAPGRAADVLGWRPSRSSLDAIVGTAWRWHASRG
ncbi:MAG: UDP-glucose 4-epimerase [Planctomycetes bacterium]|nr:UDP-glucose 4-epimerase [Planctomycetota bacterium]